MLNFLKVIYIFNVFQLNRSQDAFQQLKIENQQSENVKQQQSLTADILNRDSKNFKQRQSLTTDVVNYNNKNVKQRQSLTIEVSNYDDKFRSFITSIVSVISSDREMIDFTTFNSLNFSRIKEKTSKIINVDEYINNFTKNYIKIKIENYDD